MGSRFMVVSSSGGHFAQIKYFVDAFENDCVLILNENVHYEFSCPTHKIVHTNRITLMWLHAFEALYYIIRYRPKVIVTAGAAPGPIFGLVGKMIFRCKFVFIESFSRVLTPSMSGMIAAKFADDYICQHEQLKSIVPNAKFIRTIS